MDERAASLQSVRRSVEGARGGYAAADAMGEVSRNHAQTDATLPPARSLISWTQACVPTLTRRLYFGSVVVVLLLLRDY